MNFIEAMKLLLDGKKIRLSRWHEERYLKKYSPDLSLVLNQLNEEYRITLPDMLADDWEIYTKKIRLCTYTFEQALTALKNGAKIYRKSRAAQVHKKTDRQFLFYSYDDFEAKDWIIKEEV